jgi:L-2-hydroxyglutarate oxidase LhgO
MSERVHTIVVGAGVVGLAIARAEAMAGREVLVLEAEGRFGTGTSSRNSEILHAGIFHPPASLKARLCVAGRRALYRYCTERGIAHRRCGKLLVATDEEELRFLGRCAKLGEANGLCGDEALLPLSPDAARELEPEMRCVSALLSPSTGIIDSHQLMLSLLGDAEAHGAMIAYRSPVAGAIASTDGFRVTTGGDAGMDIYCVRLINAAGLGAPDLARHIPAYDSARVPRQYLVKGSYFTFSGRSPFTRPIYPTRHGGLSIHATIDLGGQLKFGPDAEEVDVTDYTVDPQRGSAFYAAIRTYWPHLPDGSLQPGYAGIRPKLQAPGERFKDFVIEGPQQHGVAGLVQLFGIESPGLTACLAIADHVATL